MVRLSEVEDEKRLFVDVVFQREERGMEKRKNQASNFGGDSGTS